MLTVCCTLAFCTAGPHLELGVKAGPSDRVRDLPWMVGGTTDYQGIVEAVSDDELVLVVMHEDESPREYRFAPCSVLRSGGVVRLHNSGSGYRWRDVKRGDTLKVAVKNDRVDGVTYCLELSILRRPGAKLPESQNPKKDTNFKQRSLLNDIDNGEDVSDDDMAAAFPKRIDPKDDKELTKAGLPNAYQLKLDAIRAKKKDGDLKAPPPEKK